MSGLPVQEDKRFRRAHVAPARRGNRLSRAAWVRHTVAALVVAVAIYELAHLVLTTDALAVRRVSIDGNVRMSRGEILSVLDGLQGRNILTVDLEAWRGRLKGAPWIADATVRRIFPATIRVVVQEREPIGIGRIGDQLFLVDRTGTIIDEFGPVYAKLDLPIIDGLNAGERGGGTLVDPVRAALAGRLLVSLERTPQLVRRLSQVDVSDARDAAVILDGDPVVIRLGYEQFAERLQSYVDVAETLRDRVEDIDYVDLRFGEHVYVRPRAGSERNALAQAGPAVRRSKPAGE
jgi:cell division protein FtsQ